MNNFFEGLMTEPSQFIMLACLVAFILGIILGWLIWGRKAAILGREAKKLRKELDELKKEHAELKEKYTVTDDELKKATEEVDSLNGKNRQLIIEKGQLQSHMIQAQKTAKEAEEDLVMAGTESKYFINEMAKKLAESRGEAVRGLFTIDTDLLEDEDDDESESGNDVTGQEDTNDTGSINKALLAAKAKEAFKADLGTRVPKATEEEKDDLKLIKGIGPGIEKRLNSIGLFTYEQLSKLDDELCNRVNEAIEFFPGRIQRDDWVGQAAKLYHLKQTNPGALKKKYPSDPGDLKVIEGIGPKVEEILKQEGVMNWSDLADCPVEGLQEILNKQGSRYQIINPKTWPQQAALARDGKWEELEALQEELDGGV